MGLLSWLWGLKNDDTPAAVASEPAAEAAIEGVPGFDDSDDLPCPLVNPASGLPMLRSGVIDVAGNPVGTDWTNDIGNSCTFGMSDPFSD